MNFIKHFCTITKHRHQVIKHCFKVGIGFQGLFHDLSKYSLFEFIPGVKNYQGTRSPNEAEREINGYSAAWLHHKGRNKHHFEYMLKKCSVIGWQQAKYTWVISIQIPVLLNIFCVARMLELYIRTHQIYWKVGF